MTQQRLLSTLISILLYFLPFLQKKTEKDQISALNLILTNLLVLAGVLIGGWNVYLLLFIYWVETFFLGLSTLAKMTILGFHDERSFVGRLKVFGYDLFFIFHFGLFMAVHLAFLVGFHVFSQKGTGASSVAEQKFDELLRLFKIGGDPGLFSTLFIDHPIEFAACLALLVRTAFEFYYFFYRHRKTVAYDPEKQMMEPYQRVYYMQVSVIFGGFAFLASRYDGVLFAVTWVVVRCYLELKGPISFTKKEKIDS